MRYDLKIVKTSIVKWKYLPLNIRMIGVKENCRFIDFSKWNCVIWESISENGRCQITRQIYSYYSSCMTPSRRVFSHDSML